MAYSDFTLEELSQNRLWNENSFFYSSNLSFQKSIFPGKRFKLVDVKMHFSVAVGSIVDLTVRVSSIKGSAYNVIIISQAMATVQDLFMHFSTPIPFLSDDHLVFSMILSAANVFGLQADVWSVEG